ncbi:MAG TPA: enoyl-CoA hydratase [Methylomirabilota bacterium]|jgi:enoyl-CoA hydratase|nr:enoyl-CoA hydratase [Methylomirabilota bacterium]
MGFQAIKVERRGPVLRIRMNRPDKLNAQNPTLIEEMDAAFTAGGADPDVRVIVLSGEGRAFSAGHDLEYPGYDRRGYTYHSRVDMERRLFLDKLLRIRNLPTPTIAQVHGHCVAAGLMLACMCDLIVCDETARFANPVVAMAMAGVQLLIEPWEIGARKAKELLFTAEAIDAAEAHRLGLVNRVAPGGRLEDEVDALADRIASLPAFAVRTVKKSINDTLDLMGQGRSWEHHFLLHVAGKRSEEFDQWWSAVEREGGGFKPGGLKQTFRRRADKR